MPGNGKRQSSRSEIGAQVCKAKLISLVEAIKTQVADQVGKDCAVEVGYVAFQDRGDAGHLISMELTRVERFDRRGIEPFELFRSESTRSFFLKRELLGGGTRRRTQPMPSNLHNLHTCALAHLHTCNLCTPGNLAHLHTCTPPDQQIL